MTNIDLFMNEIISKSSFMTFMTGIINSVINDDISPREREVYMLKCTEDLTDVEISTQLGISKERVRQLKNKAARKIARGIDRRLGHLQNLEEENAKLRDSSIKEITEVDIEIKLEDLPFIPTRAIKPLNTINIFTVEDLIDHLNSDGTQRIIKLRGVGTKTFNEICDCLNSYLGVQIYSKFKI